MKALLSHCKKYESRVKRLASTPIGIKPESIKERFVKSDDCISVFITIEKDDVAKETVAKLSEDIRKMCADTGHFNVVLVPFAHLSSNLASSEDSIKTLDLLEDSLKDLRPSRVHFGSDKSLSLDIYGHKGSVRFREF